MKEKDYLDPTNDYVFKRMFCESEPALLSMVNAIIQPEVPIASVTVRNSEILAPELEGHNMRLDILASLENGTRINIEMQSWPRDAFNNRLIYYFSNLYSRDFLRGEKYSTGLKPVYVIAWTRESMFKDAPFQNIFELRERRSRRLLSDHCQIHVLQLDKIKHPATPDQSPLLHWAHFLANKDPARYDELARFDSGIHNAMTTLKTLSQDEKTRMLAQAREEYARLHYEDLRTGREEGREEGRQEGREEGRQEGREEGRQEGREEGLQEGREEGLQEGREEGLQEGQAQALLGLLARRFDSVPDERRRRVESASLDEVQGWLERFLDADSLEDLFST